MTNGAGGSHGHKRGKQATGKKEQVKGPKASLKRKGLLSAGLAKSKQA